MRAADHAQQWGERQALNAGLHLAGQAVAIGAEVRIRVRRHAELGDEQRQRQHLGKQTTTHSEQSFGLRDESVSPPAVDFPLTAGQGLNDLKKIVVAQGIPSGISA